MSNLSDHEIMIPPQAKRGRHETEEGEDRLSDLPDCVILHILSLLTSKTAVQTCILSTRWKHLWKCGPALILHYPGTYSASSGTKSFKKFVSRFMALRDASITLQALDFYHQYKYDSIKPHFLKRIAKYVHSYSSQLQRLVLSVRGDSSLILPCISSCQALTSLKLEIYPEGRFCYKEILFPKYLNLPVLTTLDLKNFAFCGSENDGCADPFSAFNSLNSLILRYCTVSDAKILRISSSTLVDFTMDKFGYVTKLELSAPSLSTFTFIGTPYLTVCGNTLSSVEQLDIDAYSDSYWNSYLSLFSWLVDLPNIKSLTVTASALQVLSLVPDLLKLKFPSLSNLKTLKVKLKPPLSSGASIIFRAAKLMNLTRKEAVKILKAFQAEWEPSETIPCGVVDFLLQNSPEANVEIIDY